MCPKALSNHDCQRIRASVNLDSSVALRFFYDKWYNLDHCWRVKSLNALVKGTLEVACQRRRNWYWQISVALFTELETQ
jgi:hypothetical protein